MTQHTENVPELAGLARRLAAMSYDLLLVLALLMVVTASFLLFTDGEAPRAGSLTQYAYRLLLVVAAIGFYTGFWVHGGQTLGMQAWRIRLVSHDGGPVGWDAALKRACAAFFSAAPFGLGYLWSLVDRDGLAWHDRLSRTRLIRSV